MFLPPLDVIISYEGRHGEGSFALLYRRVVLTGFAGAGLLIGLLWLVPG